MTGGMKLLAFFSRRLSVLKHVPLLPQAFDVGLLLLSALTSPRMFRERLRLAEEVRRWPGVYETMHRYGGIQFNVGTREIGHLHGNGVLDLLFRRSTRNELVSAGKANAHHTFPDSGWVSFPIRCAADVAQATELLQLAYQWRTGSSLFKEKPVPSIPSISHTLSPGDGASDIMGEAGLPVRGSTH